MGCQKTNILRCFLFFAFLKLIDSSHDFELRVRSPLPAPHEYPCGIPIHASVDLLVGEGDRADLVRREPMAFEICISWDKQKDSKVHCQPILSASVLPDLSVSSTHVSYERVFRAWLQKSVSNESSISKFAEVDVTYLIACGQTTKPASLRIEREHEKAITPLVGVCLSGTMRTFAASSVRARFIGKLISYFPKLESRLDRIVFVHTEREVRAASSKCLWYLLGVQKRCAPSQGKATATQWSYWLTLSNTPLFYTPRTDGPMMETDKLVNPTLHLKHLMSKSLNLSRV